MNFLLVLFLGLLQIVSAARSGTYHAGWSPTNEWVETDANFASETGIDRYLYTSGGWPYEYTITIHVNEVQGTFGSTYVFYETTDEYRLTVWTRGDHSVSFNTNDDYILQVKVIEGWHT
ncbi:hypothetical protein BO70DRAFT_426985 [Aspergillus heteromorphus CBS 117.55]|uniref:Uncharacterized protein n=1 Tax=Aspergillus heteromorphus CBS 117.55 TaxID=1448321 RepID=A0A317WNU0_9EURO|nr:uncharacterized protein BO70DRAFT_426985 [Aspergillus heteromorphus CBS 117.55]PWY88139.1 hypothetical protein BO70DRAFT_426985 [Aspergillus heteromorphus CBS 117.55]